MVLHGYGVLTQAKLNVNIVATRKQLFVLHFVMKYQPANTYDYINQRPLPVLLWFIIKTLC